MAVQGLLGRGVPSTLPKWLLYLKIAIMVLALIVLALSAYAISIFGVAGTGGLLIFVAIKTLIVYGVMTAVQVWAPHMFFRLAAVIAYVLGIIFWLASWAWAASVSGVLLAATSYADSYAAAWASTSTYTKTYINYYANEKACGGAMAGAAAVGAIAWIMSIVNLAFFIRACLNDPESQGPNTTQQAELGQVPSKAQEAQGAPQPYPANYQQQPPYQQQPMPQQPPYQQPMPPQPVYGQPVQYQQQQQPYATQ